MKTTIFYYILLYFTIFYYWQKKHRTFRTKSGTLFRRLGELRKKHKQRYFNPIFQGYFMSAINLTLQNNTQDVIAQAGKQLPFALALSLTRTAQLAQQHVRKQITQTFTLRKKSRGFASSIRIKPATKKTLTAEVYTTAPFAALQQLGGLRQSHHGQLAIPIYEDISQVKRRTAKTNPAGVLANGGFITRLQSGQQVIAKRDNRRGFQMLYVLKQKAAVPKRLAMIEVTTQTVAARFALVFGWTLRDVLAKC